MIIHFDSSKMGWYALNEQHGSLEWSNFVDIPHYIHSRNTEKVIYSYRHEKQSHYLAALSTITGKVSWRKNLYLRNCFF